MVGEISKATESDEEGDRSPLLPDRHPTGDLFVCDIFDAAPKGDMASMEHPIFSLSTKPDLRVRRYEHGAKFALPACDAASRALQRHAMIDARCLQRRREAHYNAGRSADEQCEEQHAGIDMNVGDARNLWRRPLRDQTRAPDCEHNSRDSTERTEQHALGQELANDTCASCAKRGAKCDLAILLSQTCEK